MALSQQKQNTDENHIRELPQGREAHYNTNDKYEEDDIEDQIRASKKYTTKRGIKIADGDKALIKSGSIIKGGPEATSLNNTETNFKINSQTGGLQKSRMDLIRAKSIVSEKGNNGMGFSTVNMGASGEYHQYKQSYTRNRGGEIKPVFEGRLGEYKGDEDNLQCLRFPHKKYCGCENSCTDAETNPLFKPIEVDCR